MENKTISLTDQILKLIEQEIEFTEEKKIKLISKLNDLFIFTVGDIKINLETNSIKLHNKPIKLTLTEYRILSYLFRNRNKLISKENLQELISTYSSIKISQNINSLREKLGGESSISTIWGKGYIILDRQEKIDGV